MKNGLIWENGVPIYYRNDQPVHAGVVKVGNDIYYISSGGRAVKGEHIVHREMSNGILKRGTYTFGEDYRLVKGSYVAPSDGKSQKNQKKKSPKRLVVILSLILMTVLMVVICAEFISELKAEEGDGLSDNQLFEQASKTVFLPNFDDEVATSSEYARSVYYGDQTMSQAAARDDSPYVPVKFEYRLVQCTGTLTVSENADLSQGTEYDLLSGSHVLELQNLESNATYYYQANIDDTSYNGYFRTAEGTRFLSIPGLVNTRDIGGYKNQDGKTVKQGMIIRGSEADGLVVPNYFVPFGDIYNVSQTFRFAHEMDLRASAIYSGNYLSRLGDDVTHQFYEAPQYGQIFSDYYKASLQKIFCNLADVNNYPMYLHCTHGADRTGTIIFLLQGILNMSEEEMIREYQRTGFTYPEYAGSEQMNVIIEGGEAYEGDTLQEKIVSFLVTEIGVTQTEVDAIRNILLED